MNTALDRTAEDTVTLLAGQDFPDVVFVVDGDATYRMLLAYLLKKNGL